MSVNSRKNYNAAFKLKALQFAKEHGTRVASKHVRFDESLVRAWRKQEDKLQQTKKTKKAFRGNNPRWSSLENQVEEWILDQRAAGRGVSTVSIRLKAKSIANDMGINEFKCGPSWCFRFMRRKGISIQSRTTVCQKLPGDWQEKLHNFREYTC